MMEFVGHAVHMLHVLDLYNNEGFTLLMTIVSGDLASDLAWSDI